jgi:hypothetical protein
MTTTTPKRRATPPHSLARARTQRPPDNSNAPHAAPTSEMSAIAKKIVLVGGGNAAGYFARAVVAAGRGAELTMIAAENVLPYERPALTKAFLHAESPARLPGFHTSVGGGGERQTAEWYATHGVEVILGTRVVDANLEEKTVVTDAGKSYSYDKLVVAIGCTALKLPSAIGGDLPGVHRVRDVDDALALCDAMDGCAKGSVVIGGGYVGLEVAAALATRGLSPRVVMMEPHIMSRLWTREIAEKYEKLYEAKGTTFHRGAKVAKIIAGDDGRAAGVEVFALVPIRPRSRGGRRSLRTFPGVSLRPSLGFNPRPRRLSTPTDAFELHPDATLSSTAARRSSATSSSSASARARRSSRSRGSPPRPRRRGASPSTARSPRPARGSNRRACTPSATSPRFR